MSEEKEKRPEPKQTPEEEKRRMDLAKKRRDNYPEADDDEVMEGSIESFPASDPPGWSGGIEGPEDDE